MYRRGCFAGIDSPGGFTLPRNLSSQRARRRRFWLVCPLPHCRLHKPHTLPALLTVLETPFATRRTTDKILPIGHDYTANIPSILHPLAPGHSLSLSIVRDGKLVPAKLARQTRTPQTFRRTEPILSGRASQALGCSSVGRAVRTVWVRNVRNRTILNPPPTTRFRYFWLVSTISLTPSCRPFSDDPRGGLVLINLQKRVHPELDSADVAWLYDTQPSTYDPLLVLLASLHHILDTIMQILLGSPGWRLRVDQPAGESPSGVTL